jgi:hypothetical protein
VSRDLAIGENWRGLLVLMSQVVVVKAEFNVDTDTFSYLAVSDLFEEVDPFVDAPWYSILFLREEDGTVRVHSATRLQELLKPVAPPKARIRRLIEQA